MKTFLIQAQLAVLVAFWLGLQGCSASEKKTDSGAPGERQEAPGSSASASTAGRLVDISQVSASTPKTDAQATNWYCYPFNLSKYLTRKADWPWEWSGSYCYTTKDECDRYRRSAVSKSAQDLARPQDEIARQIDQCPTDPQSKAYCFGFATTDIHQGGLICAENPDDCSRDMSWDWRSPVTDCREYSKLKDVKERTLSCTVDRDRQLGAVCGLALAHCNRDAQIWQWRTKVNLGECQPADPTRVWCGVVESPSFKQGTSARDRPIRSTLCADGQSECNARVKLTGMVSACAQEQPGR